MSLRATCLALALIVPCCGGNAAERPVEAPSAATTQPGPESEPAVDQSPPPDAEPVAEPVAQPDAEPSKEIPCGNSVCTPPERCISVVGRRPGSHRKECWVTCGENDSCPKGMSCTMIHDGPGKVCGKDDR